MTALAVLLAVLAAAAALPGTATAAEAPRHFLVDVKADGSFTADYGDERLEPRTTAIGVDGHTSLRWSWGIRAVARSVRGGPVKTLRAITRGRWDGEATVISWSRQQGELSVQPLCRLAADSNNGAGLPEAPLRQIKALASDGPNGLQPGAWVRRPKAYLTIYEGGQIRAEPEVDLIGHLYGCHHGPDEHNGPPFLNQTVADVRIPRGAFNPRFDRSYSRTWRTPFDAPPRHGTVVDNNQLHTTSGAATLTIAIRGVTERRARRQARRYRGYAAGVDYDVLRSR